MSQESLQQKHKTLERKKERALFQLNMEKPLAHELFQDDNSNLCWLKKHHQKSEGEKDTIGLYEKQQTIRKLQHEVNHQKHRSHFIGVQIG